MSELYGSEIHSVIYLTNPVGTVRRNNREASPETVLRWYWLLLTSDLITESQPSCPFWAMSKTFDLNSFFIFYIEIPSWLGSTGECPWPCVGGQRIVFWFTPMTPDRYYVAMNCDMVICWLCCKLHKHGQVISLLVFCYVCIFQFHFHHNSNYITLFTFVVLKQHILWLTQNISGSRKKGFNGWGIR